MWGSGKTLAETSEMPINQFHLWGKGTGETPLDLAYGSVKLYREDAERNKK